MRKNVTLEQKTRAIQGAVREAVREHALLGRSVCVWRDEKVVWLLPEEILAEFGRSEAEYVKMTSQEPHD